MPYNVVQYMVAMAMMQQAIYWVLDCFDLPTQNATMDIIFGVAAC